MRGIHQFFERFKRLNDYIVSEDLKEAGIERINKLSPFAVPLSLARRNFTSVELTLLRPAEEQYFIMLVDFEQSELEKNLRKVHQENEALQRALNK